MNKNTNKWYKKSIYKKINKSMADKRDEQIDFIVIGDIHGCFYTLMDLINFAKINIDGFEHFKIISVGDITNKGGIISSIKGEVNESGSVNVLRWALELTKEGKLLSVDSNHGRHLSKRLRSKYESRNPNVEYTYKDIMLQPDCKIFRKNVLQFLDSLPPYLRVNSKAGREYIIAHASVSQRLLELNKLSKPEYDYFLFNNNDFKWSGDSTVITGHCAVSEPTRVVNNNAELIRLDTKVETGNGLSFYDSKNNMLYKIPTNIKDMRGE